MFYFIPAWYLKNEWKEDEQLWYRRRMKTETDDTVKQIQLFHRNEICDHKILLLSYAPNFRHFLHRQSAFRVPYWSVFDAMQEVRRKKQALLSFHNLKWPKNTEFVYTMFTILAMVNNERYASIEFGEYGNPIQIDLYRNGQISRKNIYDDRGFLSCTSVYENGVRAYDQYLTEKGVWKLCRFADGHVTVNPRSSQYLISTSRGEVRLPFAKAAYGSMEEVIEEVFTAGLRTTEDSDIFCAAAQQQHLPLLDRVLAGRKTIYSVFEHRLPLNEQQAAILSRARYLVADSEENLELLSGRGELAGVAKVNIPPYDAREDRGISQQLKVQKILLPVDHLRPETLEAAVRSIAGYLSQNEYARVHLFTRNAAFDAKEVLLKQVSGILERHGYPPGWAKRQSGNRAEVVLEEEVPILFAVEQCVGEMAVNKCMREQRVLVDLADKPDLFLQICCIGMGIPQILKNATEYMRPGKNGRLNTDISKLGEDLAYYLESLSNWNQAVIHSHELGKSHTTQYLIDQWKGVIVDIGEHTSAAAGAGGSPPADAGF